MIVGYGFFVFLVVTTVLVGIDKALTAQMFECRSCNADRFRRAYCSHCGVVGNPIPEPPKKNSRRNDVRFQ